MGHIIVIDGKGGVGKDTLCEFAKTKYIVRNVSSIDPIKEAALHMGWHGIKDNKSRKFLADLKALSAEYCDFPNEYLCAECNDFMDRYLYLNDHIAFVHIREGEQIQHFIDTLDYPVTTLLVRRDTGHAVYGNHADDDVEEFTYDYIYENNKPLSEAKEDFLKFLEQVLSDKETPNGK